MARKHRTRTEERTRENRERENAPSYGNCLLIDSLTNHYEIHTCQS